MAMAINIPNIPQIVAETEVLGFTPSAKEVK
jgi:hypothetical protein